MDTTADVLRRKRAELADRTERIAGQIAFIDELLAEMGQAGDAGGPAAPAAVTAAPRAEAAPAPKAEPPAPAQGPAGRVPRMVGTERTARIGEALLGGPLPAVILAERLGLHRQTVGDTLKGRPDWFLSTGKGPATRWELTAAGRAAASRAASPSPSGGDA